jgi:hypothetical protein
MSKETEIKKIIINSLESKTIVVNPKGDLSIDGTISTYTQYKRAIRVFEDFLDQDINDLGPENVLKMYRKKAESTGQFGNLFKISIRFSNLIDSEDIAIK